LGACLGMNEKGARRHRFYHVRLSVRAMLAFVFVIGCGTGWVVHKAHVQRDAVAAISRAGGRAYYDWEVDIRPLASGVSIARTNGRRHWPRWLLDERGRPRWPKWLVDRLEPDYFAEIRLVMFFPRRTRALSPDESQRVLEEIVRFNHLEALLIPPDVRVTDADLDRIGRLRALRHLTLEGADVTDDGLARIEGMTQLLELNLIRTRVTGAGVKELQRFLPRVAVRRSG
jgi:hypothetical protein